MVIFQWLFLIFALLYSIIIIYFFVGIYRIKMSDNEFRPFVSVLVPARNEEQKIIECLHCLNRQSYPSNRFEVIIIDDFSTDRTQQIVRDFVEDNPNFKMLVHQAEDLKPTYKKQALKFAMTEAKGEIIMTVDADTLVQPLWIEKIVSQYEEDTGLVAGIITFHRETEKNLFSKLQTLEFTGIVFCGIGSVGNKNPIICNGSNLSFRRKTFDEVGGYDSNLHLPSGDDDLLIQNIHNKTNWKVNYSLDPRTINFTAPVETLTDFVNQRSRWASKSLHYPSPAIFFILLSIYLYYILLFILFPFSLLGIFSLKIYVVGLLFKLIADAVIISKGLQIIGRRDLLKLFPVAQIFQVPYIIFVVIRGIFQKFDWKIRSNDIS